MANTMCKESKVIHFKALTRYNQKYITFLKCLLRKNYRQNGKI